MRESWWLVALLLCSPSDGSACSCVPRSPCTQYGAADAVFMGTVADVQLDGDVTVARFEVTRVWSGSVAEIVTVRNEARTSCSFNYRRGERYVVYGFGGGADFRSHMCGGGGRVPAGQPEPVLPPVPGRVSGVVWRFNEAYKSRDDMLVPMEGVRISTTLGARVVESRTDAAGTFTLDNLPAGTHVVSADVGPALEGSTRATLQSQSDCAFVSIVPRPSGRLAGVLLVPKDDGIKDIDIYAVPLTHDWSKLDLSDTRQVRVDADGRFELRGLKPGKYFVGVNLFLPPRVSQPFPPTYYPGVESRTEAVAIEIGENATTEPLRFAITRTLPLTTIRATIVCRDGSLPRAGLVYAMQVASNAYFSESSITRVGGEYVLRVMEGVAYDVHGKVLIPWRDAQGRSTGSTDLKTPSVRVEPSATPKRIELIAPLDRCQETTLGDP
jgi:hypothetical protein